MEARIEPSESASMELSESVSVELLSELLQATSAKALKKTESSTIFTKTFMPSSFLQMTSKGFEGISALSGSNGPKNRYGKNE